MKIIKIIKKDKWHILSKGSNLKGNTCTIFLFTKFYIFLLGGIFKFSTEKLFIGGDLNGHVGATNVGFERVHGGFGYGSRNQEGRMF
jgi:hypothetical protein